MEKTSTPEFISDIDVHHISDQFHTLLESLVPLGDSEESTCVFYANSVIKKAAKSAKWKVLKPFCVRDNVELKKLEELFVVVLSTYMTRHNAQYETVRTKMSEVFEEIYEECQHVPKRIKLAKLNTHEEEVTLEETLSRTEVSLEKIQKENAMLKVQLNEANKLLEIERQKFSWQSKLYENRIMQLELRSKKTEEDSKTEVGLPCSSLEAPHSLGDGFDLLSIRSKHKRIDNLLKCTNLSENTTKVLLVFQKTQTEELEQLRKSCEQKLEQLAIKHESEVTEIVENSNKEIERLISTHEKLMKEIIKEYENMIDNLKLDYKQAAKSNGKLLSSCGQEIIKRFEGLPTSVKGVLIASITAIHVASGGWASWGFIMWIWPKLVQFAEMISRHQQKYKQFYSATSRVYDLVKSAPFNNFVHSWKQGRALGECVQSVHNTDLYLSAIRIAPDIFVEFRRFHH